MDRKVILLALSGGPDSVFCLNYLQKYYPDHYIICAHVNYLENQSDSDSEQIVKKICNEKNTPLFIKRSKFNSNLHINFQSWARNERYQFFEKLYKLVNANYLVTGHNLDDEFETILLGRQLLINGFLAKMNIWRPLVSYRKCEIFNLLQKQNIEFIIDNENSNLCYERNKIRQELSKLNDFKFFLRYFKHLSQLTFKKNNEAMYQEFIIRNTQNTNALNINKLRKLNNQKLQFKIVKYFLFSNKAFSNKIISANQINNITKFLINFNNNNKLLKIPQFCIITKNQFQAKIIGLSAI